jgi:hypothetical protein
MTRRRPWTVRRAASTRALEKPLPRGLYPRGACLRRADQPRSMTADKPVFRGTRPLGPVITMGEDGDVDLDTIEERLRHPRWSTVYAEGINVWPHLIPPNPTDLAKRHPDFELRRDPSRSDRIAAWKLWSDRTGSVRLEREDTEGTAVILWDGHTQRSFSGDGSTTSTENPKF